MHATDPRSTPARTDWLPPRAPARWLAFLRIVVGAWFLKSVATKLGVTIGAGGLPVVGATDRWAGFMPGRVGEYAADNPLESYALFLEQVVIPNGVLFANLTAFGEAAVGLGLTLGLLTPLAAAVGLLVSTSYFLATFWITPGQMGFHLLLMACMLAFLGAAAGRVWGVDGLLVRRRGGAAALLKRLRLV